MLVLLTCSVFKKYNIISVEIIILHFKFVTCIYKSAFPSQTSKDLDHLINSRN